MGILQREGGQEGTNLLHPLIHSSPVLDGVHILSLVALTIVLRARQVVSLRIWKDWGSEVKGIATDAQCTDDKVSIPPLV